MVCRSMRAHLYGRAGEGCFVCPSVPTGMLLVGSMLFGLTAGGVLVIGVVLRLQEA